MRAHWGEEVAERTTAHRLPAGAVLTGHDDEGTSCAWAMGAAAPPLGAFLAWASHQGDGHLHLCTDVIDAAALARQATAFNLPATVWRIDGGELTEVTPVAVARPRRVPAEIEAVFVPLIEAAGAQAVVEEGLLRAEVLGLEVARVVSDPDGGAVLEIGVGHHDREARAMLGEFGAPSLEAVVARVRAARTPDLPANPSNQLAPERWLRAVVMAQPDLVSASALVAAPSPIARPNLRLPAPAPAVGTDLHGQPLVVVCSVGIDPDLVPLAADARFAAAAEAGSDAGHFGLTLVVPEGDDHRLTRQLAALLRHPAAVITVGADWRHH